MTLGMVVMCHACDLAIDHLKYSPETCPDYELDSNDVVVVTYDNGMRDETFDVMDRSFVTAEGNTMNMADLIDQMYHMSSSLARLTKRVGRIEFDSWMRAVIDGLKAAGIPRELRREIVSFLANDLDI